MSCTIDSKVLRNTLQSALYSNPEKYRFLENSVRDIVRLTNLTDEAKVKITVAYTELYKQLSKKSTAFKLNKFDGFVKAQILPLINDSELSASKFTDALSLIQDKLGMTPTEESTQNTRVKELAVKLSEALESPIVGRFTRVSEIADTILKERSVLDAGLNDTQELNSVKILQNALDKLRTTETDPNRLRNIGAVLDKALVKLRQPSDKNSYVDVRMMEEFGTDRYEAYLANGSVINLVKQNDQYIYLDENLQPTGQVYDLKNNPTPKAVFVYNTNWVANDGTTTLLDEKELHTGIVMVGDVQELADEVLASSDNPNNVVTVIADTSAAENNARRMEIIRNNAATRFPALANRTIETRETPTQVKALQSGKAILTRGRLTDGFSLRLVSPSGKMVTLMTFDNYVVVYPDNTTRLLDLEKDEDLNLFAQMTSIRSGMGTESTTTRPTTLGDLQVIREGIRRHKEFKAEVQALLDKGERVVPAALFSKYLELNNTVRSVDFSDLIDVNDRKRDQRLDKFMAKHDSGITVQVVNVEEASEPTDRMIPLLFKPVSRKAGSKWTAIEMLGPGEYVQVNGVNYKWVEYVEKFVIPTAGKTVANLSKLHKHPFAMLIPGPNGYAVAPLLRNKTPQTASDQAFAMMSLVGYINNFSRSVSTTAYTRQFNNSVAGFDIVKRVQPDFITNVRSDGKSFLGIQFNPTELNTDAEFFEEHKNSLMVLADVQILEDLDSTVKDFFKRRGLKVNTSTQEGIQDMYSQLDGILKYDAQDEDVEDLQEDINNLYDKFTKRLYNSMSKKIDSLLNSEDAEVRTTTERLVGDKETFMSMLFEVQNRKPLLKLNNRSIAQNDLTSYSTIKAAYNNKLTLQFNLPSALEASAMVSDTVEMPSIGLDTAPLKDYNKKPITPNQSLPNGGTMLEDDLDFFDGAFSLGNDLENALFGEGEYQRQVNYIRERLPKDIAIDDLQKIIRHLDAEGNVLGYIKDKVIYLNEELSRPGTAYHEAFHAVFRYLLSPEERANLLAREYEKMGVISESDIAEFRRKRRGLAHMSNTEVIELMAEERMADKFQSFATKKTKPATWYQKLFNLIQRLIDFFTKHGDEIDQVFDRIHSGFYKNAQVKEFAGVEGAYSLINTVPTVNLVNGSPKVFFESMNADDMMQLRNMMVYEMLRTSKAAGLSASERYDQVAKDLIAYYNIENLVAQSPGMEQAIRNKYESTFRDFRYVLGALNQGEVFAVRNLTGDESFDNRFISNATENAYTQSAQKSYAQMKQMVMEVYNNLNIISTVEDAAATDQILDEDNAVSVADAKANVEEGFFDSEISMLETGTSEGDREFRKIFQFLVYEEADPRLGVTLRKSVNADKLFDTVKKLTVNVPKQNLLPQIQSVIDMMEQDLANMRRLSMEIADYPVEYDNVYEVSQSLKAMMKMMETTCGLQDGRPTRNKAMFNQFHSVFYVSSGEITRVKVETERSFAEQEVAINSTISVEDMVQTQDNFAALNRIIENYNTYFRLETPETKDSIVQELAEVRNLIFSKDRVNEFFMENGEFSDAKLNAMADKLYLVSAKAKLGIPRHFYHYSLAALIANDGHKLPKSSDAHKIFYNNIDIYREGGYMTSAMLGAMYNMLRYENEVPLFENKENKIRKRVYATFLPAMLYLSRYDATIGQPVVRNVTGNKIYRFALYSPNVQTVQDLQQMGLQDYAADVYGPEFVQWFEDNAYLNDPEYGKLLIDNLRIGYLGGLSQSIDDNGQVNNDAADLDRAGYNIANMALFLNRKEHSRYIRKTETVNGEVVKKRKLVTMTTFQRVTSQNDSTGTVFHVTGRYENYANNTGDVKVSYQDKKVSLVSKRLAELIHQEYNFIQKQWSERFDSKKRYNGYNGTLQADGTPNTTDTKLRAYNFNQLDTFFLNNVTPEESMSNADVAERVKLREFLTNAAREGVNFEDALKDPQAAKLFEQLDLYAQDEVDFFLDMLEEDKLITKTEKGYSSEFFNVNYKVNGIETENSVTNLKQFLKDYFYNDWINRLMVNQVFDGDKSVGIADAVSQFKRQKSIAATGKNAEAATTLLNKGQTKYRHAVITVPSNKGMKELKVYFDQDDLTKPQSHSPEGMSNPVEFDIADGQVYQSLTHRMKFLDAEGKLDDRSREIISSLRYKRIGFEEIEYLNNRGIQLNSQKTVTAHPIHYLKMSEHYINRTTVSYFKDSNVKAARARVADLYKLADLYEGYLEQGIETGENNENYNALYRETIKKIHAEFVPLNGRERLHNILNNLEYNSLGQILDVSASKRGTILPYVTSNEELDAESSSYWDLENHTAEVPLRYAYNQVATEAHGQEVTDSIQPKLLIDTDLDLKDKNVPATLKKAVKEYRTLLAQMASNSRMKFERMVTKDGEIDIASFFKLVQESLQKQGAPQHMLKKWDVVDGKPVHSPNLTGISEALKYYVFSMANANLFQPKAPGFKFFHASSFGYKIIVNKETGEIVPDHEIRNNPSKYSNKSKYESRYPTFNKTNNNGVDEYYVEVLIPRPTSTNAKKLRVIEKAFEEFFGTRIPTEDKRSMVRVKVVGYIDSSYINTVIVPEQIHHLSGSDKDIDALYTRIQGMYDNVLGESNIYGDYSEYTNRYGMSEETAKFVEYLHYMMGDPFFGPLVGKELRNMREDEGYKIENLKESAAMFGPKVQEFFTRSIEDITSAMKSRYRDLSVSKKIQSTGKTFTSLEELREIIDTQEDENSVELQRQLRLLEKMAAVVNVLQGSNMPVTPEELTAFTKKNGTPVIPILQNKITSVMNEILGHQYVFENLYSKEYSNADIYKNAAKRLNRSEKDTVGQSNVATISSVSGVRQANKGAKRGIEIFASFNKGLSMVVKHGLELAEPIWNINGRQFKKFTKDEDEINRERAHAHVGNSLGMSADAAKNPYPAILSLNQYNMGVTAMMLSLGIDPFLSIYINNIPIIKKTIDTYESESQGSLRRNMKNNVSLTTELTNAVDNLLRNLQQNGTPEERTFADTFNLGDYSFNFDVEKVDANIANSENPTIEAFGLEIVSNKGKVLNNAMKDVVMLSMYLKQYQQAEAVRFEITPLTDAQKSLAPDFNTIDNLNKAYGMEAERSVFNGYKNIFSESPVYNELRKSVELMDEFVGKIFLDRIALFKELTTRLNASIYEATPDQIGSHLKNYFAMNALKNHIAKALEDPELETKSPVVYNRYQAFNKMLTADYWYSNSMPSIVKALTRKFPNNAFLQSVVKYDGPNKLKLIRSISKAKLTSDRETMVMSGLDQLLSDPNGKVREAAFKLFYYAIVKDGMGKAPYSLMSFLNPDNFREVSAQLKKVEDGFKQLDQFGKSNVSTKEYKNKFNELFAPVLGEGMTIDTVMDDVIEKIINIYDVNATDTKVQVMNYTNERGKFYKEGKETIEKAIESIRPGMGKAIIAEAETEKDSTGRSRVFKKSSVKNGNKINPASPDLLLADADGKVLLDFTNADENPELYDRIAKHYKLFPTKRDAGTNSKRYLFPIYITNTYGDMLVLKQINGESVGEKLLGKAHGRINQGVSAEEGLGNPFVGTNAVYEKVVRQGSKDISPLAFSREEAAKLNNYATGKATPVVVSTVKPVTEGTVVPVITSSNELTDNSAEGIKTRKPVERTSAPAPMVSQKPVLNQTDIDRFNTYLEKSGGVYPTEFFTDASTFKAFYNNQTGKRGKAPQSSKWLLNPDTMLYNLVDKDSGELYISDVDLKTGTQISSTPSSVDQVIKSKEEQSKDCNKGNN